MFERYTEKARRVIFMARYEASHFGSPYIETEHLLLGVLREDRGIFTRATRAGISIEAVRKRIEKETPVREKISVSVDLPLSEASKRVLYSAAEEAEKMAHKHIGSEHLLLALLREQGSLAATILQEHGVRLDKLRVEVRATAEQASGSPKVEATSAPSLLTRDLTEAARTDDLDPLIGRERELEHLMRILCRRTRNNAILVGEPEVGKSAIIGGLAYCLASGAVPPQLENWRLTSIDFSPLLPIIPNERQREDRVFAAMKDFAEHPSPEIIVLDLLGKSGVAGWLSTLRLIKPLLMEGKVQCIVTALPSEYREAIKEEPWIEKVFKCVEIQPPDEREALEIVKRLKNGFEQFHGVVYTDEALHYAVRHTQRYVVNRRLPGKALDLIDEAAAAVVTSSGPKPAEVVEAERRVRSAQLRVESAIANHQFVMARAHDEEERTAREELRQLREKHQIGPPQKMVTIDDIEQVISNWTRIPLATIRQERKITGTSAESAG
jgi:ATP-dependent Clp protease ATP-binding subunit ClpC